jgi:hypothetical protein
MLDMAPGDGQADSALTVMSETELAALRADDGARVALRNDRYWYEIFPGFYQPIHLLARMKALDVARPTRLCWGYRAALRDEDARVANGSIPVHLLTDITGSTEDLLNRNRRRDLRRCRQEVELRRVRDPSLLVEEGYRVFMSAMERVAYWQPLTEVEYQRRAERRAADERRLIIAGLADGKLGGYLESYAVDGVLYTNELIVATEALRTGISTGLYVEAIEIGARAGTVHTVCVGLHTPEHPDLCTFKAGLGFRVVHVPARAVIPGPIGAFIRRRRPAAYYRLTGAVPAAGTAAQQ